MFYAHVFQELIDQLYNLQCTENAYMDFLMLQHLIDKARAIIDKRAYWTVTHS